MSFAVLDHESPNSDVLSDAQEFDVQHMDIQKDRIILLRPTQTGQEQFRLAERTPVLETVMGKARDVPG